MGGARGGRQGREVGRGGGTDPGYCRDTPELAIDEEQPSLPLHVSL